MQQNPKTTEELLEAALVAEATVVDSSSALNNASRLRSKRHVAQLRAVRLHRHVSLAHRRHHAIVVRSSSKTNVVHRSTTPVNRFAAWNNVSGPHHHFNGVRNRVHQQINLLLDRRLVVVCMQSMLVLLMVKHVAIVVNLTISPLFVAPPHDLNSGAGTKAIVRTIW